MHALVGGMPDGWPRSNTGDSPQVGAGSRDLLACTVFQHPASVSWPTAFCFGEPSRERPSVLRWRPFCCATVGQVP